MKRGHAKVLTGIGFVALIFAPSPSLAQTAPALGTAQHFGVLGNSGVVGSTAPGTAVSGTVGSYPTAAITNFGPSTAVDPYTVHRTADATVQQAQTDAKSAYDNLTNQGSGTVRDANLKDQTLTSGIYSFTGGAADLPASATLTLNGAGVFVFNVATALTLNGGSIVTGTANPCDVYWRVGTDATLNGTVAMGTVIADGSITVGAGNVTGRVLAGTGSTGAVTLSSGGNTIGGCSGSASVDLLTFTAQRLSAGVKLSWSTGSEFGCGSFTVLRSVIGKGKGELLDPIQVQPASIPCRGNAAGSAYEIEDRSARPDVPYSYILRQYDLSGGQRQFGPLILKAGEARSSFSPK